MNLSWVDTGESGRSLEVLWEDGDRALCRGWCVDVDQEPRSVLALRLTSERPALESIERLEHELSLKEELHGAWAVRPLDVVRHEDRPMLLLEDPGGEPLNALLGAPMLLPDFLHLAIALCGALGRLHQQGLIHKDLKPGHILVNQASGEVRLTGMGLASRLLRERQAPVPPKFVAGTLAYMAPEQTGRMNRSIDSRSDLYALGVTFYQMLTGVLPFTAHDPLEWVHCHIARKPTPPSHRVKGLPEPVSGIVMKLLAKTAEERYQTAAGVEHDLQRCLDGWVERGRVDPFLPGERDAPDRLMIPEKLYGRAAEVRVLLNAIDRVIATGLPELVLVSGEPGIGKSSVVNEVHKVLVPARGLFASGKFDQYKRDVPYATIAQAFRGLVLQLLGETEVELDRWRERLAQALGANGRLVTDLVPELKLVTGEQPPILALPPHEAKARFLTVLRRFIGVFAQPEHPLTLFLDDLQWLDPATLDLLHELQTNPDVRHLMLIGAYRTNEVTAVHPLARRLDVLRETGTRAAEIVLSALTREHLGELIADSMRCEPDQAFALAQVVHAKTSGNPFFVLQFLTSLEEEKLLGFDHQTGRWSWDLDRIHAKAYTENVVDLMIAKVARLPEESREVMQQLAYLGGVAGAATLAMVLRPERPMSQGFVQAALWPAMQHGFVERSAGAFRFVHDRIQEAIYSLNPVGLRSQTHLRIGRLLAARIPPERREEEIFEIVNQLNRGAALISSASERAQLARFNLVAGRRARAAAAPASALMYFAAGRALLGDDGWSRHQSLAFELEFGCAECEFLTADLASSEERLTALSARAGNLVEQAAVTCLRVDLYTMLGQVERAVAVCLDYLRRVGVEWSPHPTQEDVRLEHERIERLLGRRSIESLIDLPPMVDVETLATMDVLTKLSPAAVCTDERLLCLMVARMVNLSLEHGNCNASCCGYVWLGQVQAACFDNFQDAARFGQLSVDLVDKRGLDKFQARVYLNFGTFVVHWSQHLRAARNYVQQAFATANRSGDLTYAGYCCSNLVSNSLARGEFLGEAEREAIDGLEFVRKAGNRMAAEFITPQWRLIRTLRGLTPSQSSLNDRDFDEEETERRLEGDPNLALATCWYWIRKLQVRVFAGDHPGALEAAAKAQALLWTSPGFFERAEYHFYAALAHAAALKNRDDDESAQAMAELEAHHRQLLLWSVHCQQNYENRAALVGAEIARLQDRIVDAERLYERAIISARASGFVHNEALACELAARFYDGCGLDDIAGMYLARARDGYLRWGAEGKVRQLEAKHVGLGGASLQTARLGTMGLPLEDLDLATVVDVAQAVSGEIVLARLVETLIRTAVQQAGAERGVLITPDGATIRIEAEAVVDGEQVVVALGEKRDHGTTLPESVLRYVLRGREALILDDALAQHPFAADPCVRERGIRSIFCLPMQTQSKLSGILYLENNLATRVFVPSRTAVLRLLASQAAIALENARLYGAVADREAKIRCLVDANIIGTFTWRALDGGDFELVEANDAFLQIVGYERADLADGRLGRQRLLPPESQTPDARAMAEVRASGKVLPFENVHLRKDGSRVWALTGLAAFDERGFEGFAFVLDLSERKRAEEQARENELQYREAQNALAHASRVAAIGQMTATIAHEVTQPLTGVVTNAVTALRHLKGERLELVPAVNAIERILRDAQRGGEVIDRIRALARKAPALRVAVEMNDAIREVKELTAGAAARDLVAVKLALTPGLPSVEGDRVQLQQVVLNLVMNAIDAMRGMDGKVRELSIGTARTESGDIVVSVRDSGPGVEAARQEQVFASFYSTKPEGMGLGLSICRSIVNSHGGRIWVTAADPRGAAFQFTLPVAAGETTG